MHHLREKEVALHQFSIRTDANQLRELPHPEYLEIGYSGNTYNFDTTVADLLAEAPTDDQIWSQEYEYDELAPDIVLLLYKSATIDRDGNLSRHAKRVSIWIREAGKWRIKFHQATPISIFEKTA